MENNTQQRVSPEEFKRNFSAAKKMSKEKREEKKAQNSEMAKRLYLSYQTILVEKALEKIGNGLADLPEESIITFQITLKGLEEINLDTLEILIRRVSNALKAKLDELIDNEEDYQLTIHAKKPVCFYSQEVKFEYSFEF